MSYFKFTKLNTYLNENNLSVKFHNLNDENNIDKFIYLNHSLYYYLKDTKYQIEKNYEKWDIYKKYTNPYEYIHTSYDKYNNISSLKPLSRAYYKMVEIINHFDLLGDYKYKNMNSFHLAEGPGGFIQAFVTMRNNINDKYYGMTLVNSNTNAPGWRKSTTFLKHNPNVIIESGITKTGDLYSFDNLLYILETYKHNKFDVVTGDGGFDFSIDFSKQEVNALRLIFSQILFALCLQKNKGKFVLKMFDLFNKSSIDLIYMLNLVYDKVYITKPKTSRFANSEKYIVCIGFNEEIFNRIKDKLIKIFIVFENIDFNKYAVISFINTKYNYIFHKEIQEFTSVIGQQQLTVINNTLALIKNPHNNSNKMQQNKKNNILKCIEWCKQNNIPYKPYKKTNVFINSDTCKEKDNI